MKKEIGERIARLRLAHRPRLTQEELAELVGVERNTVYRWEKGESYPEAKHMEALAKVLEVTIHELVGPEASNEDEKINQAVDYARKLLESVEITRAKRHSSEDSLSKLQKENEDLKAENQRLTKVLLKIPPEFFARLSVRSPGDLGAQIAWAFLSGDISPLKEPPLQGQLKSALGKAKGKTE